VLPFVVSQVALGGEGPPTLFVFASKWLFTRVDTDVGLEIPILREAFVTHLALERLLARMRS
jgi:hypothetical protein